MKEKMIDTPQNGKHWRTKNWEAYIFPWIQTKKKKQTLKVNC